MVRIYFILSILSFAFCFSQKKIKVPHEPKVFDTYINRDFKPTAFNNHIKKFPFNKTSKIKLVSYNLDFKKEPIYTPPPIGDSIAIKNYENRKFPVKLSDILSDENLNGAQQQKNLNLIEIKELSNIIFNECGKYMMGLISTSGCYFPRNAILFYDEDDKIFGYLEICFQCGGFESDPKNLFDNDLVCDDIYNKLEKFFNKTGVKTQYKEEK
ncbi:hypothetical protein SAMN05443633_110171 [Chryseobacterium arachidis]|uniref:Uncharacterized protein n=1 Tax=Chryseobacterium arachidis TaxID=1416778 RepID=A0A1M5HDK7_9FLAO|nr:hypothetical protein [Chryseobacterium arachidis]SHG14043.1 hypothetical protein SAMN05443633_110171 [Chryseobacterium arachidis]